MIKETVDAVTRLVSILESWRLAAKLLLACLLLLGVLAWWSQPIYSRLAEIGLPGNVGLIVLVIICYSVSVLVAELATQVVRVASRSVCNWRELRTKRRRHAERIFEVIGYLENLLPQLEPEDEQIFRHFCTSDLVDIRLSYFVGEMIRKDVLVLEIDRGASLGTYRLAEALKPTVVAHFRKRRLNRLIEYLASADSDEKSILLLLREEPAETEHPHPQLSNLQYRAIHSLARAEFLTLTKAGSSQELLEVNVEAREAIEQWMQAPLIRDRIMLDLSLVEGTRASGSGTSPMGQRR